jgi:hypothetical protein
MRTRDRKFGSQSGEVVMTLEVSNLCHAMNRLENLLRNGVYQGLKGEEISNVTTLSKYLML